MENINDNIELRSDKVRSIIGQIPPWIIRSGITTIFIVIILLLTGSYYFKYPYTITTNVQFLEKDSTYIGLVDIPANEIHRIKEGQVVEISFENVQNLGGLIFGTTINKIQKEVVITNKKGIYTAVINPINNLIITENTTGTVKIITDEISFFERIIKPIKILQKK